MTPRQAPPNDQWCVGCTPDNCCGCGPYFKELRIPESILHSIAEIVNDNYAANELDFVEQGWHEGEGHIFDHIKATSDWLIKINKETK